jgi:hypothetical protein
VGDISIVRAKELRAQRASLVVENGKLLEKISAEKDAARRKELETEWDKRDEDIVKLTKDIERAERQEQLDAEEARPVHDRRSGRVFAEQRGAAPSRRGAGAPSEAVPRGAAALSEVRRAPAERGRDDHPARRLSHRARRGDRHRAARRPHDDQPRAATPSRRCSSTSCRTPQAYGGAREMARVITTDSGQSLPIPTVDDTATRRRSSVEGSITSPNDMTFGQVSVSDLHVPVTHPGHDRAAAGQRVRHRGLDPRGQLITRLGRGTNVHFTTGNGTTQPKGFIPGSSSGVTGSSADLDQTDDLYNLSTRSIRPTARGRAWAGSSTTAR